MRYIECHSCGCLVRVPDSLIEARMPTPVVRVCTGAHADRPRTFRPEGRETKGRGLGCNHDCDPAECRCDNQ